MGESESEIDTYDPVKSVKKNSDRKGSCHIDTKDRAKKAVALLGVGGLNAPDVVPVGADASAMGETKYYETTVVNLSGTDTTDVGYPKSEDTATPLSANKSLKEPLETTPIKL